MAQLELDPLFVKALRLLHSKAKDSAEQLRQLIEDTLAQRQVLGGSGGKDTKSLLSTIKLESDLKSHSLSRRPSPKHEVTGGNGNSTIVARPSPEECRKKEPSPLERKPLSAPSTPSKSTAISPLLEATGLLDAKRARLESPQQQQSRSSSPASRVASSSSPATSSDGEDFTVDMGLVCVMCNQLDVTAKNQLIECQECHCLYHQECHRPPATDYDVNDPRLVWYCARCTKNMKKMAIKPSKPASKVTFGAPRELTPPIKSETPPPLTSQPFKRSELKVPALSSAGGPNKPIGLAGLAANLSKPKPLKPLGVGQPPKLLPSPAFQGLSSLAAAAAKAGSSPSTPPRSGNGNGNGGTASTSAALSQLPGGSSAAGGNGKPASSSSSLMSADKRLQIMKKKAAAKMQEKRRVTPK